MHAITQVEASGLLECRRSGMVIIRTYDHEMRFGMMVSGRRESLDC